jgi:hypothetical protein
LGGARHLVVVIVHVGRMMCDDDAGLYLKDGLFDELDQFEMGNCVEADIPKRSGTRLTHTDNLMRFANVALEVRITGPTLPCLSTSDEDAARNAVAGLSKPVRARTESKDFVIWVCTDYQQ